MTSRVPHHPQVGTLVVISLVGPFCLCKPVAMQSELAKCKENMKQVTSGSWRECFYLSRGKWQCLLEHYFLKHKILFTSFFFLKRKILFSAAFPIFTRHEYRKNIWDVGWWFALFPICLVCPMKTKRAQTTEQNPIRVWTVSVNKWVLSFSKKAPQNEPKFTPSSLGESVWVKCRATNWLLFRWHLFNRNATSFLPLTAIRFRCLQKS